MSAMKLEVISPARINLNTKETHVRWIEEQLPILANHICYPRQSLQNDGLDYLLNAKQLLQWKADNSIIWRINGQWMAQSKI